jgi:hypothetical protein
MSAVRSVAIGSVGGLANYIKHRTADISHLTTDLPQFIHTVYDRSYCSIRAIDQNKIRVFPQAVEDDFFAVGSDIKRAHLRAAGKVG